MLAALLLVGVAAAVAGPMMIWGGADDAGDDADDTAPEDTDPQLTADLSLAVSPGADLLDMALSTEAPAPAGAETPDAAIPQEDEEDVAQILAAVSEATGTVADGGSDVPSALLAPEDADLPDVPDDLLDWLEPIAAVAPDDPDTPSLPGEPLVGEVLKPVEDPAWELGEVIDFPALAPLGEAGPAAQVTDFVPGEDLLEVTLFTDLDPDSVSLDVQASADGQDGEVLANDRVIAVLRNAPDVALGDIVVRIHGPLAG